MSRRGQTAGARRRRPAARLHGRQTRAQRAGDRPRGPAGAPDRVQARRGRGGAAAGGVRTYEGRGCGAAPSVRKDHCAIDARQRRWDAAGPHFGYPAELATRPVGPEPPMATPR
jgi:hypothetical protein